MTSAVPLVIGLLKGAPMVTAIVRDRIDPELARSKDLPRVVVRIASSRQVEALARPTGLREARVNVLCASISYTTAERLGEAVIAALGAVRGKAVAGQRLTLFQDAKSAGTWDETGETYTRVIGFRASISG